MATNQQSRPQGGVSLSEALFIPTTAGATIDALRWAGRTVMPTNHGQPSPVGMATQYGGTVGQPNGGELCDIPQRGTAPIQCACRGSLQPCMGTVAGGETVYICAAHGYQVG